MDKETPRSRYLWLALVLLLGLAVKLLFLERGGVVIDSDEAIVGLMAQDIGEGRQWPIFYYGQSYMGSLEAILTAPVMHAFGQNAWTLKAVPLVSGLLFIYCIYLFAERLGGRESARIASLLAAVPPLAFVEWSTKARGGFIEVVLLGTIALNLALTALQDKNPRKSTLWLLSLVLGLAWWVNNQAIFYIVPIGLLLAPHLLRSRGFGRSIQTAAGCFILFIIGGAPFWYANLFEKPRFATFKQLGGHSKFPEETLEYLGGVFRESLPILLGSRRFWTTEEIFPYSTPIAFALAAVVVLLGLTLLIRRTRDLRGLGLPLTMLLTTPLIFASSSYGWLTIAPRYLLPLYSVWFVLVAVASVRIERRVFVFLPAALLVIAMCSDYLGGVRIPGQPFVANGERASADHTELYRWLKDHHYSHIRTNYWIGYRVAFDTQKEVTFSMIGQPYQLRIPRFQEIGRDYMEEAPFVLVPSQEKRVADALEQLDVRYARSIVSGYVILEPTPSIGLYLADPMEMRELLSSETHFPVTMTGASSRESWMKNLIDEDPSTRWGSGTPQRPGMFIEGSLPPGSIVQGVEVDLGYWLWDAARYLSVQLKQADGSECIIFDGSTEVLHDIEGRSVRFSTPPISAVGVRLEQLGSDPVFDWSIAELDVRGTRETGSIKEPLKDEMKE